MGIIVPFPCRNKGRVRKSTGANSEGLFAIHQTGATGDNVEVFNLHRADEMSGEVHLAYVVEKILNNLPREVRQDIKRSALCDAALGKTDHARIAGAAFAASFKGRV